MVDVLVFLLMLISLGCLFAGLIKPSWVIRWGREENKTRKKVATIFGLSFIIFFILFGVTAKPSQKLPEQQTQIREEITQPPQQEIQKQPEAQKPKTEVQPKPQIPDMDLSVQANIYESAPAIYIKNLNDFDWKDCKLILNDKFERKIDTIYSTKSDFWVVLESPSKEHRIALIWFSDKTGKTFQFPEYIPKTIDVFCKEPNIGFWSGRFKF